MSVKVAIMIKWKNVMMALHKRSNLMSVPQVLKFISTYAMTFMPFASQRYCFFFYQSLFAVFLPSPPSSPSHFLSLDFGKSSRGRALSIVQSTWLVLTAIQFFSISPIVWLWRRINASNNPHYWVLPGLHLKHGLLSASLGSQFGPRTWVPGGGKWGK